MSAGRRLGRLALLTAGYAALTLLDRVLFAVELERAAADPGPEDDGLEPADVSDVVEAHAGCCAPVAGRP